MLYLAIVVLLGIASVASVISAMVRKGEGILSWLWTLTGPWLVATISLHYNPPYPEGTGSSELIAGLATFATVAWIFGLGLLLSGYDNVRRR